MKKIILKLLCMLFFVSAVYGCVGISDKTETESEISIQNSYLTNLNKILPDTEKSQTASEEWYKDAVFYHIWVKAFNDSNGDRIGDIKGITQKLDYIKGIGANAIWLSPIFDCAYKGAEMHGYDTIDFYKINPKFGTKEDLAELLKEAHKKGIKIVFDFVPNLTSENHPWFIEAKKGGAKKSWYVWEKEPSQSWDRAWGGGSWQDVWNRWGDEYYYSAYNGMMPDLNFRNSEVRDEIANVLIYWLNFGFDGARVDSARYLFENGPGMAADQKETHDYYKALRKEVIDKYSAAGYGKMMVAESWTQFETIRDYYGDGKDEFQMSFDFPRAGKIADVVNMSSGAASGIIENYIKMQDEYYPVGYRAATFLCNHDLVASRPATLYNKSEEKQITAAALLMFLPGTPFIYYGNEVGMADGNYDGDMKMRTAMEWEKATGENAVLKKYTEFAHMRSERNSLKRGNFRRISSDKKELLVFEREYEGEKTVIVINFGEKSDSVEVKYDFGGQFEIKSKESSLTVEQNDKTLLKNIEAKSVSIIYIN